MPVGRAEPCKGSQQVGNGTQFIQPWCVVLSSVVMASLIEDSLNSAISSPSPAPCSNTQTVSQHGEATVFCFSLILKHFYIWLEQKAKIMMTLQRLPSCLPVLAFPRE